MPLFPTQDLPPQHPANVAYLVTHPLLGYHKHWKLYCEEKQDDGRELGGQGAAREVEVASFQVSKPDFTRDVQYLVSSQEIHDHGEYKKTTASAAPLINIQVTAAAAASAAPVVMARSPAASVARPSQARVQRGSVPETVLADLRMLNSANRTQLKEVIERHACLKEVKTGSNKHVQRNNATIAEEIRQALQRQYPSTAA